MHSIKYIIGMLLMMSCSTGHIVTTNFHNLAGFEDNSHVYVLPKTRILVDVTVEETSFTPGPYRQYAKKFLGIEEVRTAAGKSCRIVDVKMKTQSIPDADYTYSVRNEEFGDVESVIDQYRAKGLIMCETPGVSINNNLDELTDVENKIFTDLSIRPFVSDNGKAKKTSSGVLLQNDGGSTSIEQKAQEAALFLFKIRKRRFKLVSGQYAVFPEGVALEKSIEELDRIEKEYLGLFIGVEQSRMYSRTFTAIPAEGEDMQRFPLFRFSEGSGLSQTGTEEGEAVILQVINKKAYSTLAQYNGVFPESKVDKIYYRLANQASAKLLLGSHEILEAEIPVFQFGVLIPKGVKAVK